MTSIKTNQKQSSRSDAMLTAALPCLLLLALLAIDVRTEQTEGASTLEGTAEMTDIATATATTATPPMGNLAASLRFSFVKSS